MSWYYLCDDEGECDLNFLQADSRVEAAEHFGVDSDDPGLRSNPEWNALSDITPRVLADAYWWQYCHGCESRIDGHLSYDEEAGDEREAVFDEHDNIYCSAACLEDYSAKCLRIKATKEATLSHIAKNWPWVTSTCASVGGTSHCKCFDGGSENVTVELEFPGAAGYGWNTYCAGCRKAWIGSLGGWDANEIWWRVGNI